MYTNFANFCMFVLCVEKNNQEQIVTKIKTRLKWLVEMTKETNNDLAIPSPVITDKLDILLQHHPDTKMVLEPLTGFMEGFMTGIEGPPIKSTICRNLQFTHKEQNGLAVTELLTKEVNKGYRKKMHKT